MPLPLLHALVRRAKGWAVRYQELLLELELPRSRWPLRLTATAAVHQESSWGNPGSVFQNQFRSERLEETLASRRQWLTHELVDRV